MHNAIRSHHRPALPWIVLIIVLLLLTVSQEWAVGASKAFIPTGEPPTITTTPTTDFVSISTITPTVTDTFDVTPTNTLSPEVPTETLTPTSTPAIPTEPATQETSSAPQTTFEGTTIYLPLIFSQVIPPPYTPAVKALFCDTFSSPRSIPDNNPNGVNDSITINDSRQIVDIDVYLDIDHSWVGDLNVNLTHVESDDSVNLIHRPGRPASSLGCGNNNIKAILDDEISSPVENKCASSPAAISGIYIPNQPLDRFDGDSLSGEWRLNVSDNSANSTGTLRAWCMLATISENPEPQPPPPPPPDLPSSAILSGVTGQAQTLSLDCESRSAVDWARYMGVNIDELDFFHLLPHSDNPDKGFAGNVYGAWGQIPPDDYGVHAEPVAVVLRDHGLEAYAHRPLSWDDLRAEIAAGKPVIVWINGSVDNGIPVYYTPSDGLHTIVARYEHTVVVTGYNASSVYYLNGATIYTRTINQFLDSWSSLGNMAITARP